MSRRLSSGDEEKEHFIQANFRPTCKLYNIVDDNIVPTE